MRVQIRPEQERAGEVYNSSRDHVDGHLREVWVTVWKSKWLIFASTVLFAISGVLISINMPNQYKAEVLLAPSQIESDISGLASKFGGLASLAGINIGGRGNGSNSVLAQEVLRSRRFITSFIKEHELLVPLMASYDWESEGNQLLLDSELYDQTSRKWIRKSSLSPEPSEWEAYKEFSQRLSVTEDKKSSFVTISFEFYSPVLAKQWIDWLVSDLNEHIRREDVKEAQESIAFLERKLGETSYTDLQKIFFQLIEEQTQTIMLAEVRDEYVFKTVDPAVVPEEKSKPKRALLCVFSAFFGGGIALLFVLSRYFLNDEKQAGIHARGL